MDARRALPRPSSALPRAVPALLATLLAAACAGPAPEPEDPAVLAARESDRIHAALVARHDRDGDGRISAKEYARDAASFAHLDRDDDGMLTRADHDVPITMPADLTAPMLLARSFGVQGQDGVTQAQIEAGFVRVDADPDGRLTRAEFLALPAPPGGSIGVDRYGTLLAAVDRRPGGDGDGALTLEELLAYLVRRDTDGDGVLVRRERLTAGPEPVDGWFEREAREPAPDFTATAVEGTRPVSLRSLRGQPVALIFGSFT
jgi:hypothetical protein